MATSRRDFLKWVALGAVGAQFAPSLYRPAPAAPAGTGKPLNILFIMTDQHNARALGCYGNADVKTPAMDRLASEGTRFTRAFCNTGQCCPSRYSIWTGRYARSHGLYWNGQMENAAETTVGDIFRQAGYRTATIGKHHMHMDKVADQHGFDVVIDMPEYQAFARAAGAAECYKAVNPLPVDRVHPGGANVGASPVDNEHHPAGYWATQTIEFLRENKDRPFCAWLSFYGPHTPIVPSQPWAAMYDPAKITLPANWHYAFETMREFEALRTKSGDWTEEFHRATLAMYYGLVSQIDHNIGRVLDELDRLGLSENTLVIYTADHGEMMSEHGAWTKGRTGYDATVRVPLIVRLPGVVAAGKVAGQLVCSIDLLPTLLDLAGQPIPENIDGRSLAPLLGNQADVKWREVAFSEIGPSAETTCLMARTDKYKYVLFRDAGQTVYEQLFDLAADPWEMKNEVANPDKAAVLADLRQKLADWEKATPAAPAPASQPAAARPRRQRPRPRQAARAAS